eukprot:2714394-Prymnesium_polylepis.1
MEQAAHCELLLLAQRPVHLHSGKNRLLAVEAVLVRCNVTLQNRPGYLAGLWHTNMRSCAYNHSPLVGCDSSSPAHTPTGTACLPARLTARSSTLPSSFKNPRVSGESDLRLMYSRAFSINPSWLSLTSRIFLLTSMNQLVRASKGAVPRTIRARHIIPRWRDRK